MTRAPTSLRLTSDSGIGPERETSEYRTDASVEVMRDRPVVRFLFQQRDDEDLRRLEEESAEEERDIGEITDLDPLPHRDGRERGN